MVESEHPFDADVENLYLLFSVSRPVLVANFDNTICYGIFQSSASSEILMVVHQSARVATQISPFWAQSAVLL